MRREVAQPLGQRDVRTQRAVLLGRKRRHVHGIDGDAVLQIFHDLLGDAHAHDLLRFFGGAADVRRGDHCVAARTADIRPAAAPSRKRRARRPPLCRIRCALRSASSSTSSPRAQFTMRTPVFICAKASSREHVFGFGRERDVQRDVVALRVQLARDPPAPRPGRCAICEVTYGSCAIMRISKARARFTTSRPMLPKPDDAQRFAAQLAAQKFLLFPLAALWWKRWPAECGAPWPASAPACAPPPKRHCRRACSSPARPRRWRRPDRRYRRPRRRGRSRAAWAPGRARPGSPARRCARSARRLRPDALRILSDWRR